MSHLGGRNSLEKILQAAVAIAALLLAATPVLAANRQAQERKARTACLNGNYTAGVSILSELFVDTKDPTHIFNQGRCFEQNRRYEDAIGRFEEYLRVAEASSSGLSPKDRSAAEKHIADLKSLLAEQLGKSSAPTAPQPFARPSTSPAATPEPAPRPEPNPETPVLAQPESQPASPNTGSGLRTVGIITASFGVAAVVAGVVFNLQANSAISEFETKPGSYTPSKDSNRKTYRTLAWTGYGVGAACVAAGAVLFGIGLKAGRSASTSVALLPTVGDGHAGVALTGGF